MNWLYSSTDPIAETLVGSLLIFILIILVTRIVGLRSFAKFTVYDFAITVAVGSIISSTLTSSTSIVHGFTAIAALLLITLACSYIQKRSQLFDKVISNQPLLLMKGSKICYQNMKKANVQKEQLMAKLREANVHNLEQVCAVVLECTGDISVIHKSSADEEVRFEEILLLGVRSHVFKK